MAILTIRPSQICRLRHAVTASFSRLEPTAKPVYVMHISIFIYLLIAFIYSLFSLPPAGSLDPRRSLVRFRRPFYSASQPFFFSIFAPNVQCSTCVYITTLFLERGDAVPAENLPQ